jgi:hypothetical protein
MRNALEHSLDALEMISFNNGFEACLEGLEQISDKMHNKGDVIAAELIRATIKEMRGENV